MSGYDGSLENEELKNHVDTQEKKQSIVHRIMQRYNIRKRDIPGALLTYKAMNWGLWFGMIALFYRFSPTRYIFRNGEPKKLIDNMRANFNWYRKSEKFVIDKSKKMAENDKIKTIFNKMGAKPKKMPLALAESTILYKLLAPIHLPLQFMVLIQMYNIKNYRQDSYKVVELN